MKVAENLLMILTMRIEGHLETSWSDWFEGMEMRHLPDGTTELKGPITDQAALHGMLNRARDLNLTLIEVSVETAVDDAIDQESTK